MKVETNSQAPVFSNKITDDTKIAILAGNSRVSVDEVTGKISIEPQLFAFKAALISAIEIFHQTGIMPCISVAFDHTGVFRKQFLKDGLTNSQKRNPNLSQLKDELTDVFEPIAEIVGVPINYIKVIHEDSARSHAKHLIEKNNLPKSIVRWMKADPLENNGDDSLSDCSLTSCKNNGNGPQITCAAITSEYYISSTPQNSKFLKVFIENTLWSKPDVYVRGVMLANALGHAIDVQINLVNSKGIVFPSRKL